MVTTAPISVDELRVLFGTEKAYPRFTDFRRFVIEPSVKEIQEALQFDIDVEYVRKGRSVDAVIFSYVEQMDFGF